LDYKDIEVKENFVLVKGVANFDPVHIFECGQCFRWNKVSDNDFIGVAYGRVIEVVKEGDDLIIFNSTEEDFYNIWCDYFDLRRNYSEIKAELSKDPLLKKAVDFGYGIRILNQEPFEIVNSFIISANNRIPMIKRAIENISKRWGEPLEYKGVTYYAFPSPERLAAVEDGELESCGLGFRAKYVKDTVSKIHGSLEGQESLEKYNIYDIAKMDDDHCHKALQEFKGIGPKVADCIMLFSMNKITAFPVDVWVKRAMVHFYTAPDLSLKKIRDFARDKFGEKAGFAQQYLFYYARENNIKIE
jgi:N-glycosylase/DNA lyase